jgi:hypothetical protein
MNEYEYELNPRTMNSDSENEENSSLNYNNTTNGNTTNASTTNEIKTNGNTTNASTTNGIKTNGNTTNASTTNEIKTNGNTTNGNTTNRKSLTKKTRRTIAIQTEDYTEMFKTLNENYNYNDSKKTTKRRKEQHTEAEYKPDLQELYDKNMKEVLKRIDNIPYTDIIEINISENETPKLKSEKTQVIDDVTKMIQYVGSLENKFYKLRIIQFSGIRPSPGSTKTFEKFLDGFLDEIYLQEKARKVLENHNKPNNQAALEEVANSLSLPIIVPKIIGYNYLFRYIDGKPCFLSIFAMENI